MDSKENEMFKKIDWDLVQIIFLVGTVPTMILIGALVPSFFANYR